MRYLARWAVVVMVVGCGGVRASKAPAPATAAQYAATGSSAVPAQAEESSIQGVSVSSAAPSRIAAAATAVSDAAAGVFGGDAAPPPSPAELAARQGTSAVGQVATSGPAALPEQLVVEGWFGIEVDDVRKTAAAIRKEVAAAGGRVVSENLGGSIEAWSGEIEVRVPPVKAQSFVDWLEKAGDVRSRRVLGTDVSRTLFDKQIELENNELTLRRLQKLLDRGELEMKDVLAIEAELTRVRGSIERIKGEQRFLQDRVALATLHISLSTPPRDPGVVLGKPETKLYPGPRLAMMALLTADGRERYRLGGGVTVGLGVPRVTAELDVFEETDDDGVSVLATIGGAVYSDHFGFGRRRFLNPYLGLRTGYGYLGQSAFVVGGEVGLELFKHRYVLVDANVRVFSFLGSDSDVAAVGALSTVFAF